MGDRGMSEGEAMLAHLRAMIERELTPEQLAELRKRLDHAVERAGKLRMTPLGNADEPEIGFRPYRKDELGS